MDWVAAALRYFHDLAAIVWLGLNYETDFLALYPAAAPVLRGAALVTWLLGCGLLSTLSIPGHHGFQEAMLLHGIYAPIGIGAWLGTLMLVISIGPMRTADPRAGRRWARVNTILSVPMLFFMVFGYSHQGIVGL